MDAMDLSATAFSGKEEVVCYSFQECGTAVLGPLPRRVCACRGSNAGYVHLFCIAKYATDKSGREQCLDEFKMPWEYCSICVQKFRGEFAVAIATEFALFI